jgi:hypothetical protein
MEGMEMMEMAAAVMIETAVVVTANMAEAVKIAAAYGNDGGNDRDGSSSNDRDGGSGNDRDSCSGNGKYGGSSKDSSGIQ